MTATKRLPRGRHGLSREEVAADQRLRMLLAMAEAMAVNGYVGTSVADVIRRAGVSRETFYQQFSSKEECFMAAFDAAGDILLAALDERSEGQGAPLDRFARAMDAYLEALVAEPAFARLFLVEVHAAGAAALQQRRDLQLRFAERMAQLLGLTSEQDLFACRLLVAGVATLVTVPLVTGDTDAILELRGSLLDHVRRILGQATTDTRA